MRRLIQDKAISLKQMSRVWQYRYLLLLPVALMFALPLLTHAQDDVPPTSVKDMNLFQIINSGSFIGYLIIALSVLATFLVVEHFISIRRSRLIPDQLVENLENLIAHNQIQQAKETCELDGSLLANILKSGLEQSGSMFGFYDMQTAMQDAGEREISKLYRKLEYLDFIAATAPMLGLLGTVVGMIGAFASIDTQSQNQGELATFISQALVTTAMGLIVAIPTKFFVSFFKNRIDSHVAEAETTVDKLTARFKQSNTIA